MLFEQDLVAANRLHAEHEVGLSLRHIGAVRQDREARRDAGAVAEPIGAPRRRRQIKLGFLRRRSVLVNGG